MKFYITLLLLASFLIQPCAVYASANGTIESFEAKVKRQTKDQYQFKKVHKKFDPYLLTFTNNTNSPILLTTDSTLAFLTKNDEILVSDTRREIYRATRAKDIGKYYGIGLPCSAIAGGIIGLTFGL